MSFCSFWKSLLSPQTKYPKIKDINRSGISTGPSLETNRQFAPKNRPFSTQKRNSSSSVSGAFSEGHLCCKHPPTEGVFASRSIQVSVPYKRGLLKLRPFRAGAVWNFAGKVGRYWPFNKGGVLGIELWIFFFGG